MTFVIATVVKSDSAKEKSEEEWVWRDFPDWLKQIGKSTCIQECIRECHKSVTAFWPHSPFLSRNSGRPAFYLHALHAMGPNDVLFDAAWNVENEVIPGIIQQLWHTAVTARRCQAAGAYPDSRWNRTSGTKRKPYTCKHCWMSIDKFQTFLVFLKIWYTIYSWNSNQKRCDRLWFSVMAYEDVKIHSESSRGLRYEKVFNDWLCLLSWRCLLMACTDTQARKMKK